MIGRKNIHLGIHQLLLGVVAFHVPAILLFGASVTLRAMTQKILQNTGMMYAFLLDKTRSM